MEDLNNKDESAMGENKVVQSGEKGAEPIDISGLPDFVKNILKRSENIPQEALDEFPSDYSENLDHYLYGLPKKSP